MKYERTNYPYKDWANKFIEHIKNVGLWNSKHYYRFRTDELWNYLLDQDIDKIWRSAVFSSMMYHIKKAGFYKSDYPKEYKKAKNV